MKLPRLAFVFSLAALTFAAEPDKPAADDYPLKTCIVSDEPLPADFVTFTHKEAGKPDVTVRLCCEGCIEDFRANPAKFLKKLVPAKKK